MPTTSFITFAGEEDDVGMSKRSRTSAPRNETLAGSASSATGNAQHSVSPTSSHLGLTASCHVGHKADFVRCVNLGPSDSSSTVVIAGGSTVSTVLLTEGGTLNQHRQQDQTEQHRGEIGGSAALTFQRTNLTSREGSASLASFNWSETACSEIGEVTCMSTETLSRGTETAIGVCGTSTGHVIVFWVTYGLNSCTQTREPMIHLGALFALAEQAEEVPTGEQIVSVCISLDSLRLPEFIAVSTLRTVSLFSAQTLVGKRLSSVGSVDVDISIDQVLPLVGHFPCFSEQVACVCSTHNMSRSYSLDTSSPIHRIEAPPSGSEEEEQQQKHISTVALVIVLTSGKLRIVSRKDGGVIRVVRPASATITAAGPVTPTPRMSGGSFAASGASGLGSVSTMGGSRRLVVQQHTVKVNSYQYEEIVSSEKHTLDLGVKHTTVLVTSAKVFASLKSDGSKKPRTTLGIQLVGTEHPRSAPWWYSTNDIFERAQEIARDRRGASISGKKIAGAICAPSAMSLRPSRSFEGPSEVILANGTDICHTHAPYGMMTAAHRFIVPVRDLCFLDSILSQVVVSVGNTVSILAFR